MVAYLVAFFASDCAPIRYPNVRCLTIDVHYSEFPTVAAAPRLPESLVLALCDAINAAEVEPDKKMLVIKIKSHFYHFEEFPFGI